ncbi:UNVERIFIED_CONTAM: hypothetical protein Sangu_2156500 [Sesamum angustifolium]|uniref:Uncharacterized protein n=1 Tax=Sesamum angustifolium TaxID=2727405 RepID=A0AAW2LFT4_9LAMI
MTGKTEVNDLSRNGVIRMIVGGPIDGGSQRARKAQVREAYGCGQDMEPANDTPLIQFGQEERCRPRT